VRFGAIIVLIGMLIEIVLVDFFEIMVILVDMVEAMGVAMMTVVLSMVVLSHRASAYYVSCSSARPKALLSLT